MRLVSVMPKIPIKCFSKTKEKPELYYIFAESYLKNWRVGLVGKSYILIINLLCSKSLVLNLFKSCSWI